MPSRKNNPTKITGKSQAGQQVPDFTEDQAREHIERILWPNGPFCRSCGSVNVYRMQGASVRPGLCRCRDCNKQLTVTVGTIFEDSHLPLAKWVKAIHLMSSSKKGISALQLQRNLGLGSYRTAWFMCHRIRLAMKCEPMGGLLKGAVQVDEAYIGGKPRHKSQAQLAKGGRPHKHHGRATLKTPVIVLVETDGRARCQPTPRVNSKRLKSAMKQCIDPSATIITDELNSYPSAAKGFAGHETVQHNVHEYVNENGFNTNTAESFFALLKRGVHGTFHHVSKKHLHRYCDEFSFRWDGRKLTDNERRHEAVKGAEGKRLMYKTPVNPPIQPPQESDGQYMPFDC